MQFEQKITLFGLPSGRAACQWTLFCLLLFLLAACGKPVPVSQESYVFGTRVEVLVWGVPEAEAHAAVGEVLREFRIIGDAH